MLPYSYIFICCYVSIFPYLHFHMFNFSNYSMFPADSVVGGHHWTVWNRSVDTGNINSYRSSLPYFHISTCTWSISGIPYLNTSAFFHVSIIPWIWFPYFCKFPIPGTDKITQQSNYLKQFAAIPCRYSLAMVTTVIPWLLENPPVIHWYRLR